MLLLLVMTIMIVSIWMLLDFLRCWCYFCCCWVWKLSISALFDSAARLFLLLFSAAAAGGYVVPAVCEIWSCIYHEFLLPISWGWPSLYLLLLWLLLRFSFWFNFIGFTDHLALRSEGSDALVRDAVLEMWMLLVEMLMILGCTVFLRIFLRI